MKLPAFNIVPAVLVIVILAIFVLKIAKRQHIYLPDPASADPHLFNTQPFMDALKGPNIQEDLKIFVASSLDRIFLNGHTLLKPSFSSDAYVSAARNEYASFQVVVNAHHDEPHVFLELSDLIDSTAGQKISSDHLTWRMVGYVQTIKPYYPVKFVGLWPDPLIPVKSWDIKAGNTQPFWVDIYVPPGTPAGDYQGSIIVKGANFAAKTLDVHLHVYNFILSQKSHLKTAFDFYNFMTKFRYPQGQQEPNETWYARLDYINDQFIIDMLKHRMDPVLNIDPSSQTELSKVDRYMVYGLNNFSIGRHGGTFDNNWPHDDDSIEGLFNTYRTYGEDLKINDLLDYTYIYTWDEGQIGNPRVREVTSMIHRAYPGLKNMVCYHGFWDPSQDPEWGKDIDIWTFHVDNFDQKKIQTLQKRGMEIWMYVSGPSDTGAPNLAMDFDSIDYRIIPWICWKYDIRGFLYWSVNYWPKADPFQTAQNTDWQQNSNGLLFYPGPDAPWDSLRVENFRDGMQDYEYIYMLLNDLRTIHAHGLENKYKTDFEKSIKLLTMDDSLVKSVWSFTKDGEYLKSRRDALALEIEQINRLLNESTVP